MATFRFIRSLALLLTLAHATPVPATEPGFTRRHLTATQVQQDLGSQMSIGTLIFGASDVQYANATERWQSWELPTIEVIVQVAQESDIGKIVRSNLSQCLTHLADGVL